MSQKNVILLTDIPVWSMHLVEAIKAAGVNVRMLSTCCEVPEEGLLINRVSAGTAATQPLFAREVEEFMKLQEQAGRKVINGSSCYRLGYDKRAQAKHFESCDVHTPATYPVDSSQRKLPDTKVIFKPVAGGFGKGIVLAEPGTEVPESVSSAPQAMIEQEYVEAADGCVHRIEILGDTVLYDAATKLKAGESNYCLTSADRESSLSTDIDPKLSQEVIRIAQQAHMDIGSLEYLIRPDGSASYIDLNPVSSYHQEALAMIGFDPFERCAQWLREQA